MIRLNLYDLDNETAVRLRARAAGNECSIEEEALSVLRFALVEHGMELPPPEKTNAGIHERAADLGITDVDYMPYSSVQAVFGDDEEENAARVISLGDEFAEGLRSRALVSECSLAQDAQNVLSFALSKPACLPQPRYLGEAISNLFKDLNVGVEVRRRSEHPDHVVRFYWLD